MFETTVGSSNSTPDHLPLRLYDNEDVEGILIDLGVGYLDENDVFQYGDDPSTFGENDTDDFDSTAEKEFDQGDTMPGDTPF